MKAKIEDALSKVIGYVWITTFTIGSIAVLIAITKWFLSLIGVI